jgi:uridine kinase
MRPTDSPIDALLAKLMQLDLPHPVRVAIDGRTASGKTTFANQLALAVERAGRPVIRASIDDFHHPRAVRHRQGRLSADGYYEDARDLVAFRALLLDPLGPDGDGRYVSKGFDLESDTPVEQRPKRAKDKSVLIVDGTFLQRPEIRSAWDLVVFLDIAEVEALRCGVQRDHDALGGVVIATELYHNRYGPAFDRYAAECRPVEGADVVIEGFPDIDGR